MSKVTKNQHFVPRCLLRNFTTADQLVNIYDSTRDKLRPPTIIERVFAENYFYDKDNLVENFLAEYIEAPASEVLKMFRGEESKVPLDAKSQINLLRFILVQLSRTPSAHFDSLQVIDNVFDELIKQIGTLNGFDSKVINSVKFNIGDPKDILRMQTVQSALQVPLILDLDWHFLVNETAQSFIISDNPVVHYNWYLRNLNIVDKTSLAKRGAQIFLPVSDKITLCLYDSKVYKMGDKNSHYTKITNSSDIRLLNELQFRSRQSYIVFTSRNDASYVESACSKFTESSLYSQKFHAQEPFQSDDEHRSQIVQWREQHLFTEWLTFCKVKKKLIKRALYNENRQPELLNEHVQQLASAREKRSNKAFKSDS